MRAFQAQAEEPPAFQPLPQVSTPSPTGSMSWLLAGGVLLFLLIAGILLYMSSGGSSGKTNSPSSAAAAPTVAPEASGGGPAPAVGKVPGQVKKGVVPDLKDLRLDDALAQLDSAGLSYVVVETSQAGGQAGVV